MRNIRSKNSIRQLLFQIPGPYIPITFILVSVKILNYLISFSSYSSTSLYKDSSFVSRLFSFWLNPLIKLGASRPLEFEDVPEVDESFKASVLSKTLRKNWEIEREKGESWWRLAMALWWTLGWDYVVAGVWALTASSLMFLFPILTSYVVGFVQDQTDSVWTGFQYVGLLFLTTAAQVLAHHYSWQIQDVVGVKVKNSLSVLVYEKSLTISEISSGNASNLLNVDPYKCSRFVWVGHSLWNVPYQLIISMVMLFMWLGLSSFASLAVTAILIPTNYYAVSVLHKAVDDIMKKKDARIEFLVELLSGIQVIKLFSWETKMYERVNKLREEEVKCIKKFSYSIALLMSVILVFQQLLAVATFTCYVLLGNTLDPKFVFPALVIFNNMAWPVLQLPDVISSCSDTLASMKRLNKFLRYDEVQKIKNSKSRRNKYRASKIDLQNCSFEFYSCLTEDIVDEDEAQANEKVSSGDVKNPSLECVLKNVNLHVDKSESIAIFGRVGAGKSSLLRGILGELKLVKGKNNTCGTISFVSQQAWIRNETVKNNILFGEKFEQERYDKVVDVCSLIVDFSSLPNGDETEVGEKGVNLSGGQKQRISLARACYSHSDIILLDDPLSALDSEVGHHVLHKCILKYLKDRIVVLVTHQFRCLPFMDRIILMKNGSIDTIGSFEELSQMGLDMSKLVQEEVDANSNMSSSLSHSSLLGMSNHSLSSSADGLQLNLSSSSVGDVTGGVSHYAAGQLIEDEEREMGNVSFSVYQYYFKNVGRWWVLTGLALGSVFIGVLSNAGSVWIRFWSELIYDPDEAIQPNPGDAFYVKVYIAIIIIYTLISTSKQFAWFKYSLDASISIHTKMLKSVLSAPMSFFVSTPSGRIVNRFSKDQLRVDKDTPDLINDFSLCVLSSFVVFVLIIHTMPWFILGLIPMVALYGVVFRYFRPTSRELQRLESISNSPIFSQYSETLSGLETIRAHAVQKKFSKENQQLLDSNMKHFFHLRMSFQWIGIWTELIGAGISAIIGIIGVLSASSSNPGSVGLALSLASFVGGMEFYFNTPRKSVEVNLSWLVKSSASLEASMSGLERIMQLTNVPSEGKLVDDGKDKVPDYTSDEILNIGDLDAAVDSVPTEIVPPRGWPVDGRIDFNNVYLRYRDDLEDVLCNITFSIKAGEKIGIIGRTGAGKSSLTNSLFRLANIRKGTIEIDGIDIHRVKLARLRSSLAVIPQDPFLFTGTVRDNLDPFETHSDGDVDIWSALDRSHLSEYIKSLHGKLNAPVSQQGSNFSVGQRQLLCLARSLLSDPKILIMDEATASVDNETDLLIQETVRNEFIDRTVLIVAHRIHTVMHCDRILVMDKGKVKEFDSPLSLSKNKKSFFYKLVEKSGESLSLGSKDPIQPNLL